ncbi:MAG: serine acetyltransferase [Prevotella sp.]|uniref:serine O-acetyltransferase n=1 Tax=Prevotella sp. TaxID=59823 RepID=UPI002A2D97E5|nr:serine acetyltransferase [Prevotella sp.]MDD7317915.1 serine acetyltransferase [Prevotellaceae bacterium]MDY4020806.1 serine acetyltransferase [Prevotella sp.]
MQIKNIENVSIPIPESYRDCFVLIKSDAYRYLGGMISIKSLLKLYIKNSCFVYNFWLRLSSYDGMFKIPFKIMQRHYSNKYGIFIPSETKIGYGFFIGHNCGIVINPTAVVGNNVNISQFTTIGSNDGQAAIIDDEVYIGPGVSIVENVRIGKRATIGAGAVVVKDVNAEATVAGVPAKQISLKDPGRYIGNIFNPNL